MTLGVSRPRNWGIDEQRIQLHLALSRANVAYQVKNRALWITTAVSGKVNEPALPFPGSCADLIHVDRGRWEARHVFSGRLLARGCSVRDVVGRVIGVLCLGYEPAEARGDDEV